MTVKTPIYLDYAATCPVDQRVVDQMVPFFTQAYGNAASRTHAFGWTAEEAVERAREQVAQTIGAEPKELTFTSGATESNNLAIKGIAEYLHEQGDHVITVVTEHKAVLDTCKHLERQGKRVTYLPVDAQGLVTAQQVADAITDETVLVSVMFANNETGVIQPIAEIGKVCHDRKVLFHTDAVQAFGKVPIDVQAMNIDLLSMSAHKIYGPKGVGGLYVRRRKPRVRLAPQIHGGGHERGNRSGTLNVPAIVGFGAAAEIARQGMGEESVRIAALRNRLRDRLREEVQHVTLNGSEEHVLPGTLNMSFSYIEGESLLMALKDVALSSGSACTSASLEPSYVLRAMGLDDELAHSSLRMTIGRFTTQEEVDYVVELIGKHVTRLRDMSPLWEMVQEGIDLNSIQWTAH
ncbi:IscS subfamily cysteine desulfurase [Paraliomyxa miuraensis]|uniref:IscS subfamily cysteine desulfurase n=1 Tax=Paraliomyxa miuraensis TaxID=376150 RepID=UPI002253C1C1|nr:IscS subfamily cysteine desulfurase [Paraliomyxa miuraensis]MCX4242859.1 IscS subfamily cysteine desulfurase [Paraliomyxa miuraensis]